MSRVGQPAQEDEQSPEGGRDPRRVVAKLDYELGLPLRTVGAKVGVSEAAIRLWAKEEQWARPSKTAKVHTTRAAKAAAPIPAPTPAPAPTSQTCAPASHEAPECEVLDAKCEVPGHDQPSDPDALQERFRQRVKHLLENPTRDEAADVAARAVVQVVREHRVTLTRAQVLADRLLGQLDIATATRDELEEFILSITEPGKYRSMLMKLVSLPSHAGTLKDIATAMGKLTGLERQAFGLATVADPTPPAAPPAAEVVEASVFDRIRERVQLRLAGGTQT